MPATVAPVAVIRILRSVAQDGGRFAALAEEAELPARGEGRWSVELLYRVWAIALREARRGACSLPLPIALAQSSCLDEWGMISWVARTAPTSIDAVRAAAKCHRLISDRGSFEVDSDRDVLRVRWCAPAPARDEEAASDLAALAYFLAGMRELLGSIRVREVELRDQAGSRERAATSCFFGAPVRFGAPAEAIVVDRRSLPERPPQAHEPLFRHLIAEADTLLAELAPSSWTARVDAQLAIAPAEIEETARALAISARSLQRRLREEGTSFRERRDVLQRASAERALAQPRAIGEVSDALGFSDPSAFARAHRRWFGAPPSARRRVQS